jgi:hypothetical protein
MFHGVLVFILMEKIGDYLFIVYILDYENIIGKWSVLTVVFRGYSHVCVEYAVADNQQWEVKQFGICGINKCLTLMLVTLCDRGRWTRMGYLGQCNIAIIVKKIYS